jgi:hypothetical protein
MIFLPHDLQNDSKKILTELVAISHKCAHPMPLPALPSWAVKKIGMDFKYKQNGML